jgi:hypothetical protein
MSPKGPPGFLFYPPKVCSTAWRFGRQAVKPSERRPSPDRPDATSIFEVEVEIRHSSQAFFRSEAATSDKHALRAARITVLRPPGSQTVLQGPFERDALPQGCLAGLVNRSEDHVARGAPLVPHNERCRTNRDALHQHCKDLLTKGGAMNIEDKTKDGTAVTFVEYRDGELWYRTAPGFEYPAPAARSEEAVVLAQTQAMQFLR